MNALHESSGGSSVIELVSESTDVSQAFCRKSAWSDTENQRKSQLYTHDSEKAL